MIKNIFFSLLFLLVFGCNTTNKEIFIIDKNIQGYMLVIFNGHNKSKSNDRKYTFSNQKIFFSDFEKKIGLTNVDAYVNGTSLRIPFILKGQISSIGHSELNKIHLVLLGGFSSKDTKTNENVSLNIYWLGELSNLDQNDVNRVVAIIENNATLENLKNNTIFSLIE